MEHKHNFESKDSLIFSKYLNKIFIQCVALRVVSYLVLLRKSDNHCSFFISSRNFYLLLFFFCLFKKTWIILSFIAHELFSSTTTLVYLWSRKYYCHRDHKFLALPKMIVENKKSCFRMLAISNSLIADIVEENISNVKLQHHVTLF